MIKYLTFTLFLCAGYANAVMISLQSLDIAPDFSLDDTMKTYWEDNTSGQNVPDTQVFDTFDNIETGGHSLNLLTVNFNLSGTAEVDILAGLDAQYGAEIYVADQLMYSNYNDIWWRVRWDHSSVIELNDTLLTPGSNVIEIFWAESCCNGPNSVMFGFDQQSPFYLNTSALTLAVNQVPTPNTLSILLLGMACLIGMVFWRGRKPL